jgi:transposase
VVRYSFTVRDSSNPCRSLAHNGFVSLEISKNAIRPLALGRKNYLLAGFDVGGERAAAACWSKPPSSTASIPKPICEVSSRIVEHPINRIAELLP